MNELAVRVRSPRERYGDVAAVDGVGLAVRRSEVSGLLGPDGAGKSTTVEIPRADRPRVGGDVLVLGSDPVIATRVWRSWVGIVWQDESAPAELTVGGTVRHSARSHPRARDPGKVIGLVGLEAKAGSRTKALSAAPGRGVGVIGSPACCSWTDRRRLRAGGATAVAGSDPAARGRRHHDPA